MNNEPKPVNADTESARAPGDETPKPAPKNVPEIGGAKGPDPTRYGDWERNGRCIDF
jgi:hypothetical protein